jgi:hypothetical protein
MKTLPATPIAASMWCFVIYEKTPAGQTTR